VPDRLESAFAEQLGGCVDERIPATLALRCDSAFGRGNRLGCNCGGRSDNRRRCNNLLGRHSYLGSEGSLGSHGCGHLGHGASQAGAA
jgi:hypothetical protein